MNHRISHHRKAMPLIFLLFFVLFSTGLHATAYFIDSNNGKDEYDGSNPKKAWKSLGILKTKQFQPGDIIHFVCGSEWVGELTIISNGTKEQPIVFRSYGKGNKPVISNPAPANFVVDINGSWIILDGFLLKDAHNAGVRIAKGSNHNTVTNCEIVNTGMGIGAYGKYNLFTRNYVHDLHIIRNSPRDVHSDDDYGAVAFWMFAPNNEISYNKAVNCTAPSYDYGVDGGFFEIYGNGDSTYVHHNWAENCVGFNETGAGVSKGVVIAYNVSLENDGFIVLHLGKNFHGEVENMRVENNTIISKKGTKWNTLLNWSRDANITPSVISFKNNLILIGGETKETFCRDGNFVHENNLYYLLDGATVGFELGKNELIGDPLFKDFEQKNFNIAYKSPARKAGQLLGYRSDFNKKTIPPTKSPDIGAYEYH